MRKPKKKLWDDGRDRVGPPTAAKGQAVGIGWYDPATFSLFKSIDCDVAPESDDWESWFKTYQLTTRRAAAQNLKPHKLPITARSLLEWLEGRDLANIRQNRIEYVTWLLEQRLRSESD